MVNTFNAQVMWMKPHYTKVHSLSLPDGKKLKVKSGTQIIDRCWQHLRSHLKYAPVSPATMSWFARSAVRSGFTGRRERVCGQQRGQWWSFSASERLAQQWGLQDKFQFWVWRRFWVCRGCAGIGSKRRSIVRPRKSFASLWLSGTRSVASARTTKPFPIKHAARCIGSKAPRTKNPRIQNRTEGPETFGFFGFPRVFCFSNKNPKTTRFFGFTPET